MKENLIFSMNRTDRWIAHHPDYEEIKGYGRTQEVAAAHCLENLKHAGVLLNEERS